VNTEDTGVSNTDTVRASMDALVPANDDSVFLLYEYELTTGERYRNIEFITVRNGRLVETQVFFGGRV
jgi:hypothetical protein